MRVMLVALQATGFEEDTHQIKERWQELKLAGGYAASPEFAAFYPVQVLDEVVTTALSGFDEAGVRGYRNAPSDSVARVLNQAWNRFWSSPTDFVEWEQRAVDQLLARRHDSQEPT